MGDSLSWTLWVDQTPRPGWANMSIDRALLERSGQLGESWLRLYTWSPFCLSFGRHEPAARRYDRNRILALGLDTVRRPTGGRAVWHSRELTYAVAMPCRIFGSLQRAYLEIHQMLAQALRATGYLVSLAPRTRALSLESGACFAEPVGGEIVSQGRKLVGSAQLRRGTALLQHGSILLSDEQQVVAACAREASTEVATAALDRDQQERSTGVSADQLIDAISTTSRRRWAGEWHQVTTPDAVLAGAQEYAPRFRSPAWTWER